MATAPTGVFACPGSENLLNVLRVSFVGTRTQHFDEMRLMFRDVLGMEVAFSNPGRAGFTLASGHRDLTGGDQNHRWGWFVFRAPDDNIYVIQQDGLSTNE